jgi:hypothetical protein
VFILRLSAINMDSSRWLLLDALVWHAVAFTNSHIWRHASTGLAPSRFLAYSMTGLQG